MQSKLYGDCCLPFLRIRPGAVIGLLKLEAQELPFLCREKGNVLHRDYRSYHNPQARLIDSEHLVVLFICPQQIDTFVAAYLLLLA